jgi:hypothetical protein
LTITNQLANCYMLSFVPRSATPGLHTIEVTLNGYPNLRVSARTSYWIAVKANHDSTEQPRGQEPPDPR